MRISTLGGQTFEFNVEKSKAELPDIAPPNDSLDRLNPPKGGSGVSKVRTPNLEDENEIRNHIYVIDTILDRTPRGDARTPELLLAKSNAFLALSNLR